MLYSNCQYAAATASPPPLLQVHRLFHTVACQAAGRWCPGCCWCVTPPHQQAAEDDGQGHRALAWQQPTADNRQRQQGVSKRPQLQEGALAPKNAGAMKDTLPRACFRRCRWQLRWLRVAAVLPAPSPMDKAWNHSTGPLGRGTLPPPRRSYCTGWGRAGVSKGVLLPWAARRLQCTAYC